LNLDEPLVLLGRRYAKPEVDNFDDSTGSEEGCSLSVCTTYCFYWHKISHLSFLKSLFGAHMLSERMVQRRFESNSVPQAFESSSASYEHINIRLFGSRTIVLHDTHLLCFSKHVAPDYIHHPMSLAVHGLHLLQARLYVCVAWPAPIYCTVSIPEHWQTLPINLSSFLSGGRDLASISSRCLCAVVVLLSLWLSCPRCDVT
jgi:hypothetical protein